MSKEIRYIEPNDIEFKNEDLCIGVKLEVDVPGRALSAANDGISMIGSWTTIIGDVNLFGNKVDGFMTTSYSDISSLDNHNGGNMDSIGIETINIRYNSWMFPEVDIKFIDIRGNAVMNPMECRKDGKSTGSFLNALFSFPYPMFRLTVKGYYGKPVTYKLTVRDVRTNFNSQTGNFEFSVKFIGYMYGYLTDVPMQYVSIAPYIQYGNNKDNLGYFSKSSDEWQGGDSEIPTFPQFLASISNAITGIDNDKDISVLKTEEKNFLDIVSLFNEINKIVKEFKDDLSTPTFRDVYDVQFTNQDNQSKYTLTKIQGKTEQEIKDVIEVVNRSLKTLRDTYGSYKQKTRKEFDLTIFKIADFTDDEKIVFNFKADSDLKVLKTQKGPYIEKLEDINKEISAKSGDFFKNAMGWDPTIGNVVEMVLAHLKLFYENVEACINDIRGNSNNRQLKKLKVKNDVKYLGDNITVPPFPLITNNDGKYMWLGDAAGTDAFRYDEKNLVEEILDGVTQQAEDSAKELISYDLSTEWAGFPRRGIPNLMSDIYLGPENVGDGNPYENQRLDSADGQMPDALKVFAKRLALRYIFDLGEHTQPSNSLFGEIEALNFWKCNLNSDRRETLRNNPVWSDAGRAAEWVVKYLQEYLKDFSTGATYSILYASHDGNEDGLKESGEGNEMVYSGGTWGTVVFKDGNREVSGYKSMIEECSQWVNGRIDKDSHKFWKKFPIVDNLDEARYDFYPNGCQSVRVIGGGIMPTGFYLKKEDDKKDFDIFASFNGNTGLPFSAFNETISFEDIFSFSPAFTYRTKIHYDFINYIKLYDYRDENLLPLFFVQLGMVDGEIRGLDVNLFPPDGSPWWGDFNDLSSKIDNCGICKISHLVLMLLGWVLETHRSNLAHYGSMKLFIENYYNQNKNGFIQNIKDIVNDSTNEIIDDKDRSIKISKLSDKSKKILQSIFNKKVVVYNLHAAINSPLKNNNRRGDKENVEVSKIINASSHEGQDTESIVTTFIEKIKSLNEEIALKEENISKLSETKASSEKKMSVYLTLKELYDRWKFGAWRTNGNEKSHFKFSIDIDNFVFVDSYYTDVSRKLEVNVEKLANLVRNVLENPKEISVYSFIFNVCEIANMTLSALPINIYDYLNSTEKMMEVFTPYPYMACDDSSMQTTYVATYSHKPSSHLNITDPYNGYDDDGLDFKNLANDIVFKDNSTGNGDIPVFGVTYGLSNQRIFKDIQVGMDNPKTTAHSLMSELMIANQGKGGANSLGFEAHDIFDVYASKSYTCKVDMLGCAQIMPLMYFQLNNIPLFKGGYLIISAEHNISKNGMTTSFTGVRLNKNRFELSDKKLVNTASFEGQNLNQQRGEDEAQPKQKVPRVRYNEEDIRYSKESTLILLDAGHDMKTYGKQSPEDWYYESGDGTGIWNRYGVLEPDMDETPERGTMRAKYPDGTSAFNDKLQSYGGGRYREYWGNRKIVNELRKLLKKNEYNVEIVSSQGVDANEISKFSNKVNSRYRENGENCILISVHSNAIGDDDKWNDSNYWSIYCQGTEYVSSKNDYVTAPRVKTSRFLGECIAQAANRNFSKMDWNYLNEIGKVNVHQQPKVFETSFEGIRPTTYALPPTVLSENLFHTNKNGVKFLGSKEGAEFIARIHFEGIEEFLREMSREYDEKHNTNGIDSSKPWHEVSSQYFEKTKLF